MVSVAAANSCSRKAMPQLINPPPRLSYGKIPNSYGPYAYCSLDKAVAYAYCIHMVSWCKKGEYGFGWVHDPCTWQSRHQTHGLCGCTTFGTGLN